MLPVCDLNFGPESGPDFVRRFYALRRFIALPSMQLLRLLPLQIVKAHCAVLAEGRRIDLEGGRCQCCCVPGATVSAACCEGTTRPAFRFCGALVSADARRATTAQRCIVAVSCCESPSNQTLAAPSRCCAPVSADACRAIAAQRCIAAVPCSFSQLPLNQTLSLSRTLNQPRAAAGWHLSSLGGADAKKQKDVEKIWLRCKFILHYGSCRKVWHSYMTVCYSYHSHSFMTIVPDLSYRLCRNVSLDRSSDMFLSGYTDVSVYVELRMLLSIFPPCFSHGHGSSECCLSTAPADAGVPCAQMRL